MSGLISRLSCCFDLSIFIFSTSIFVLRALDPMPTHPHTHTHTHTHWPSPNFSNTVQTTHNYGEKYSKIRQVGWILLLYKHDFVKFNSLWLGALVAKKSYDNNLFRVGNDKRKVLSVVRPTSRHGIVQFCLLMSTGMCSKVSPFAACHTKTRSCTIQFLIVVGGAVSRFSPGRRSILKSTQTNSSNNKKSNYDHYRIAPPT